MCKECERLKDWLSLIVDVNACDYEYRRWAKQALAGWELTGRRKMIARLPKADQAQQVIEMKG
jgi:hypothetical protein